MKREHLDHLIRAAGFIVNSREIVIIGSQAILGSFKHVPEELLSSMEADMFPMDDSKKADIIDGSIGEESPFHETYGYYAHGISPKAAILPKKWKERLVRLVSKNTNGIIGLCLHPIDIAISKLIAGREKDIKFVKIMIKNKLVAINDLEKKLNELPKKYISIVKQNLKTISK